MAGRVVAIAPSVRRRRHVNSAEDALGRAEELLARLETARVRLEATEDPETAIDTLAELAEIARQVEAELQQARRAGSADG
ncbi:MAG: hypothetical protein ABR583_11600 [Gaiellaceae bacterium]